MKYILGYNENFQGYKKYVNYHSFLSELEDGEADEIRGIDICDYIAESNIKEAINKIIAKVKLGGTFVFGGTDITQLALAISNDNATVFTANRVIFSQPQKRGLYNIEYICSCISGNVKITGKTLAGYHYTITGVRI